MDKLTEQIQQQHCGPFDRPRHVEAPIEALEVHPYLIPTEGPEADGTLEWRQTLLLLVEIRGGGLTGLGYSYASYGSAYVTKELLADIVIGRDAFGVEECWWSMLHAVRNIGRPGVASMAISAVDSALWDLKAKLLGLPLVTLLGSVRDAVSVYGSGGFLTYDGARLARQLGGWAAEGIPRVKMKIGRDPAVDLKRIAIARRSIGDDTELFVDANGGYSMKQSLWVAERAVDHGVTWLEEPVSSEDLEALRLLRERVPAPIDVAAGEYGYDIWYFRRMLAAGAVDVLQADATRCGGITGFLKAAALCDAQPLPLSAHCAPSLHLHPCCAGNAVRHLEYFYDHVRIEQMLFDGAIRPIGGSLRPDRSRAGLGLEFKHADARRYAV
jgi:L-alanine-DL-glutamate epimerase-like enolase superfamily enzyme